MQTHTYNTYSFFFFFFFRKIFQTPFTQSSRTNAKRSFVRGNNIRDIQSLRICSKNIHSRKLCERRGKLVSIRCHTFFFFFFSFSIPKKSSQIAIEYFKIILIRFQIIIATLFFPLSFFYFATNFNNFPLLSNTSCFVLFFFPRIDNKFVAKNKFRTNTERKAVF